MITSPVLGNIIPPSLTVVDPPALASEISKARQIRLEYLPPGWPDPYLNNVVRAFRLANGAERYLEISSRDKGHLAWVSTLLAPSALVVDVDVVHFPDNEERLRNTLNGGQSLMRIIAEPNDPATASQILKRVDRAQFDIVFANFASYYSDALFEISTYFDFVRPGGFMIVNDAYWEGDNDRKGKSQALQQLDTRLPIYCVHMDDPIHRFMPIEQNGGVWGTLAIIQKPAT
jgi:hypothetical protein